MTKRSSGFTLIELMIVVAVIAILASIAVPSYRSYVMRTNRAQAKNALLQIQVAQEKFFLQKNTYINTTSAMALPSPDGLNIQSTTENGLYNITIGNGHTGNDGLSYLATATAKSSQTADTSCLIFSIDEQGNKTPPASSDCWKK